jgi:hypothetical protein
MDKEAVDLLVQMTRENPTWIYDRIQGFEEALESSIDVLLLPSARLILSFIPG